MYMDICIIHKCISTCMFIYLYIYIYTHTHTHTQLRVDAGRLTQARTPYSKNFIINRFFRKVLQLLSHAWLSSIAYVHFLPITTNNVPSSDTNAKLTLRSKCCNVLCRIVFPKPSQSFVKEPQYRIFLI